MVQNVVAAVVGVDDFWLCWWSACHAVKGTAGGSGAGLGSAACSLGCLLRAWKPILDGGVLLSLGGLLRGSGVVCLMNLMLQLFD